MEIIREKKVDATVMLTRFRFNIWTERSFNSMFLEAFKFLCDAFITEGKISL